MSRKRAFVLFALLVATIALSLTLARRLSTPAGTVAERESLTTDTDSKQLQTSAERVAFLGRYLKLRTQVRDAAFHIVYHDNSHGLPGPSDWSILAAVAVTPADGPAWLSEAQPLERCRQSAFGGRESPRDP